MFNITCMPKKGLAGEEASLCYSDLRLPPIGMPAGRGSIRRRGSPDLDNSPYNSQSLAAGGSALLDAINRGKVHLAKFILDAGECDVANTKDFKGKTPLIRACYIREQSTRDRAVRLLLSKGADVNLRCDIGRTALSYAVELRCNDVVRILVKNNVDPDIPDDFGNTPLMYSAIVGNDIAINILIRSFRRLGLQVDHVNNDGYTALLLAAKHGNIACASMLAIDGRACISFRDKDRGLNAEEWAREHGCSTPEVMPFSHNALLYQQKFGRPLYTYKFFEEEDEGSNRKKQCGGKEQESSAEKELSFDYETGACKDGSFDYERDEDNVTKSQEADLRAKLASLKVCEKRLVKRGSLPAIKLCGGNSAPKKRPTILKTDSVNNPQKRKDDDKLDNEGLEANAIGAAGPSPTSLASVDINLKH